MTKQDQWYLEKDFNQIASIINDLQIRVTNLKIKIFTPPLLPKQDSVEPEVIVKLAEFTPKQLNIIGIALENWLIEDTCISTNGKGGKPFIDKAINSKTFFERLTEASKFSE